MSASVIDLDTLRSTGNNKYPKFPNAGSEMTSATVELAVNLFSAGTLFVLLLLPVDISVLGFIESSFLRMSSSFAQDAQRKTADNKKIFILILKI